MSVFRDIAAQFGVSKPIYTGNLDSDGTSIRFELKDQYDPSTELKDEGEDPIKSIIAKLYRESYSRSKRKFEHSFTPDDALNIILGDITKTYKEISPLKNPKQSRLFKWLHSVPRGITNNPSTEGFIGLFRYIRATKLTKGDSHAANVLAILEMMREKY